MFWLRRVVTQRVLRDKLPVLETLLRGVSQRGSAEEGGGKFRRARVEHVEQPCEDFCGIEASLWTAGTEILSACVFELWTGILIAR